MRTLGADFILALERRQIERLPAVVGGMNRGRGITFLQSFRRVIILASAMLGRAPRNCRVECEFNRGGFCMRKRLVGVGAGALLLAGLSLAADKPDPAKGKEVFEQCAVCHNADTDEKTIGPSLKGLFKHATLKNGNKVTKENVKAMINSGGNGMPSYADLLSEQEKTNLIAYLKTL